MVNPFGGSAKLKRENTPDDLILSLPPGSRIPLFWLGVGSGDKQDMRNAQIFEQLLQTRQPGVTLRVVPGGGHSMFTWRSLMPSLLEWMTPQLAHNDTALQQRQAQKAQQAHRARAAKHTKHKKTAVSTASHKG
jgi:hypothetical protein